MADEGARGIVDIGDLLSDWDTHFNKLNQYGESLEGQKKALQGKMEKEVQGVRDDIRRFRARWDQARPKGGASDGVQVRARAGPRGGAGGRGHLTWMCQRGSSGLTAADALHWVTPMVGVPSRIDWPILRRPPGPNLHAGALRGVHGRPQGDAFEGG